MQKEQSDDPQVVKYRISYLDPATGLRADCHATGFREFNTVEWVMNFTNTSSENSDTLELVRVADYTMETADEGDFKLLYAEGSYGSRADFRPILTELGAGDSIRMAPENGRSSDRTAFPFFNLESPDKKGVVVGIGWTGGWYATLSRSGKAATLNSGMEKMKLYLRPGESIRTPRICMLFWQGNDPMDGNNRFRRFMLAHHTRKIDGKFAEYPLSAGFDWGDPAPCNEYGCLTEEFAVALINRYKQFGIVPEVFWLDARAGTKVPAGRISPAATGRPASATGLSTAPVSRADSNRCPTRRTGSGRSSWSGSNRNARSSTVGSQRRTPNGCSRPPIKIRCNCSTSAMRKPAPG